jgi:hypothetical protein
MHGLLKLQPNGLQGRGSVRCNLSDVCLIDRAHDCTLAGRAYEWVAGPPAAGLRDRCVRAACGFWTWLAPKVLMQGAGTSMTHATIDGKRLAGYGTAGCSDYLRDPHASSCRSV